MNYRYLFSFTVLLGTMLCSVAHGAGMPPPSIGVSPARMEITIGGETTTGSATVLNLSDRPIHVTSSVVDFELDEGNNFHQLAPEPGSLPSAMMVNPVDFTIPPNGSQTVRFAIMPERLHGPGEHRAMLFFSELVETNQPGVKLNFRLGMPIYASLGEVDSVAHFNDIHFDADTHQLELDISSIGTAQVRPSGYYLWWPASDYPSKSKALAKVEELTANPGRELPHNTTGGRLSTKPVFAGTRRSLITTLEPPPDSGEYLLVLHVSAGGREVQRTIHYTPPEMLIVDSD